MLTTTRYPLLSEQIMSNIEIEGKAAISQIAMGDLGHARAAPARQPQSHPAHADKVMVAGESQAITRCLDAKSHADAATNMLLKPRRTVKHLRAVYDLRIVPATVVDTGPTLSACLLILTYDDDCGDSAATK